MLREVAPRRLEALTADLLTDEPVIVLSGPRTVGKSTLLQRIGDRFDAPVLDLDDVTTRALVADDLGFYVRGRSPVLIDEFEHVPSLLDAIKAELNVDTRPGRFVLTGSTRDDSLPRAAQSLTGRVHVVTVWPLSQGEINHRAETFTARLLAGEPLPVSSPTSREEYVQRVLAGGLPAPLRRTSERSRTRWFDDYVRLVIERDALPIRNLRQSATLPLFLRRVAAQTAGLLNVAHVSRESDVSPSTGEELMRLLESVFLVHRLPAWGTTLTARVNRHPKIHMADTGLGGRLLQVTASAVSRRIPSVMVEFGHLVETFVVNEVLKQLSWLDLGATAGHYRTSEGIEVDLVVELPGGDLVAIGVKPGSTYRREDLRGLLQLRDRLGDRFIAGALLYTGDLAATVDDRISVQPISSLWA